MKEVVEAERKTLTDKKTYENLFQTLYQPLCRYAYSILNDTFESEDAVQRVFYELWDKRFDLNINSSVKSYLYRAVHNTCLNRIKQLKTQAEHNQQIAKNEESVHDEVYENIIGQELDQKIRQAIDELPPKCKEVFELSRFQMLSYKEIAQELDISPNTVENQIAKALKLLRISLKDFIPAILLYYLFKTNGLW